MLQRLASFFHASSSDAYVQHVTSAIVRDGLQPRDLDSYQAVPGLEGSGRVVQILRKRKLSPREGAEALRLSVSLFRKMRHMAEARGWPLKSHPATDVTRMEAYFLELLDEAARSVQLRA